MSWAEYMVTWRDATKPEEPELKATINAGELPAHLYIETGHFYPDDLDKGQDHFAAYFRRVARYAGVAAENYAERTGIEQPRVSTVMMIDDYRKLRNVTPEEVIGGFILPAAEAAGISVDYIARDAACAEYYDRTSGLQVSPADILTARIIDEPIKGVGLPNMFMVERGWLANGQRPVADPAKGQKDWQPAEEYGAQLHSIFMDVEIFRDEKKSGRLWACPLLASVWQAARLGDLHNEFAPAMTVQPVPRAADGGLHFGEDWDELPAIMQLHDDAHGFEAYSTFSVLPTRYLGVEGAVRTILGHIDVNEDTSRYMHDLASAEGLVLSGLTDRLEYVFTNDL